MRIAIGGISHETNTFSTLHTRLEDFRIQRGREVLADVIKPFHGITFTPTLFAYATPGGLIEKRAYLTLRDELLAYLEQALPLDGIYLSLHGAMEVEGIGDGESDLLLAIRSLVGDEVPIAVSLDLHGNIAPDLVKMADILTAYRTAPHRDHIETCRRALRLLVRCIQGGTRPVKAFVKIPIIIPGEFAVTDREPARSLYEGVRQISLAPGMLDASLLIGCAWTDSPHTSLSVIALAESDHSLAHKYAVGLAEEAWRRRCEFRPEVEALPVDEAIRHAISCEQGPVFISDSGDNITAGGAGDIPLCLEKLLEARVENALVAGICDAEAASKCLEAGVGATLHITIGGKLDRINGRPLDVTAKVMRIVPEDEHGPSLAVVKIEGVDVILTSKRYAFTTLFSFSRAGVDPTRYKIVVVKMGYLFPELRTIARHSIWALTPGFTDLCLERLQYKRLTRPIYPLDGDFAWEARSNVVLY